MWFIYLKCQTKYYNVCMLSKKLDALNVSQFEISY